MEEIKLNLDNLTDEEREQLMKLVEKGNQKKAKVWKPVNGNVYYIVATDGCFTLSIWEDKFYDKTVYELGNCYKTVEEARFAVEKRKVEVELQRFADEHNDADDGFARYYITYHVHTDTLYIMVFQNYLMSGLVFFSSEEIAKQAIETIGKDRIKKYIFGVK